MQTSSHKNKTEHFANPVSIALYPMFWKGKRYKDLAPSKPLHKAWQNHEISEAEYLQRYTLETLSKLDPAQVYRELGEDAMLLCWCRAGEFCHRRLAAKWFEKNLGVSVPEAAPSTEV